MILTCWLQWCQSVQDVEEEECRDIEEPSAPRNQAPPLQHTPPIARMSPCPSPLWDTSLRQHCLETLSLCAGSPPACLNVTRPIRAVIGLAGRFRRGGGAQERWVPIDNGRSAARRKAAPTSRAQRAPRTQRQPVINSAAQRRADWLPSGDKESVCGCGVTLRRREGTAAKPTERQLHHHLSRRCASTATQW
ncbi:hypothetical protein AAFF_G00311100 [Aldrovandia affinis]|uniref:Uncharacterized protein n=1 Tax=Aldrovandia affinis TaxID=143900 RepID=A0AAD7R7W1_9TELE|nr:hypothetical protein AAFF_G00311100 [Aldrovandia affinis]